MLAGALLPALLGLLLGAAPARALPLLGDNGRAFCTALARPDFACLDAPGLLGLAPRERDRLLDHAAAQGFSAVSFDAPLFGPRGLVPSPAARPPRPGSGGAALERALEACSRRGLYAFPVLYPPSGVDALVGTATARAVFFAGRRAWGWQRWALGRLASLRVDGLPLPRSGAVGGWLLYRGPWPGGPPFAEPAPLSPGAEALIQRQRALFRFWTAATVRAARQWGFRQELGEGLWLDGDLAAVAGTPEESPDAAPAGAGPPLGPLDAQSGPGASFSDALPPVPGAGSLDDSALLPPAPDGGEGGPGALDWRAVGGFLEDFPRATELDFLELTLDTEDWFGAAARLAEADRGAEVPVLWRQDWRQVPGYERGRRLRPPAPLAGLCGPWPSDDWQTGLWRTDPRDPKNAPFRVEALDLERRGRDVRLRVRLSRPASLEAAWGPSLPFRRRATVRSRLARQEVDLGRLAPGAWFLLKLKASSPRYGTCLLRTRWVRAP